MAKEIDYLYGSRRAIESSMSRIIKHTQGKSVTLSACRNENTPKQNLEATYELVEDLKASGWGYIPLAGGYVEKTENGGSVEVIEHSFMIPFPNSRKPEATFEDLILLAQVLAEKYKQESILVVEEGHGKYLSRDGKEESIGEFKYDPNTQNQYFSALAKGNYRNKKWVFEGMLSRASTTFGKHAASLRGELE